MDAAALTSKVEQALSGKILQKTRFGKSGVSCFWIEARDIPSAARALKDSSEIQADFLENLSVMQLEDALVLTYFILTSDRKGRVILRASLELKSQDAETESPSVAGIWKSTEPFEAEAEQLFGIRFGEKARRAREELWQGFPMRRNKARKVMR